MSSHAQNPTRATPCSGWQHNLALLVGLRCAPWAPVLHSSQLLWELFLANWEKSTECLFWERMRKCGMSLEDSKDSVMLNEEGLGVALPGAQRNLPAQVPLTSDNLKHKWRHCENISHGSSPSMSIFLVTSKSNLSLLIRQISLFS